jgi:hypothetical protein
MRPDAAVVSADATDWRLQQELKDERVAHRLVRGRHG